MSRFRLSVAGLLGLIAAFGFGLAALRYASSFWLLATALGVVSALLGAILGAIFRRGHARVYWIGFALFGWSFLFLFGPRDGALLYRVPGSAIIYLSSDLAHVFDRAATLEQEGIVTLDLALLFALTGGLVARGLASRQEAEGRNGDSSDPRRTP